MTKWPTKLTDLIVELPIIEDATCDAMVDWFEQNKARQVTGAVGGTIDQTVNTDCCNATDIVVEPSDKIFSWIAGISQYAYSEYLNRAPGPTTDIVFNDFAIRSYKPNEGFFVEHTDQHAGGSINRIFAIIMYLNTVDEGGETEFPQHNIKIKPEKGQVLLFPGNYLFPHKGNMPISNSKYIATSWVEFKEMPAKLMRLHGKW